jgi:hypothetical protein
MLTEYMILSTLSTWRGQLLQFSVVFTMPDQSRPRQIRPQSNFLTQAKVQENTTPVTDRLTLTAETILIVAMARLVGTTGIDGIGQISQRLALRSRKYLT